MPNEYDVVKSGSTITNNGNGTYQPKKSGSEPTTPQIRKWDPTLDKNPAFPEWLYHLPSTVPTQDYIRLQDLYMTRDWHTRHMSATALYDTAQMMFDVGGAVGGAKDVDGVAEERHKVQTDIGRIDHEIRDILDRNNLNTYTSQIGKAQSAAPKGDGIVTVGQYWTKDGKTWRLIQNGMNLTGGGSYTGLGLFGLLAALMVLLANMITSITMYGSCAPHAGESTPAGRESFDEKIKREVFTPPQGIEEAVDNAPWDDGHLRQRNKRKAHSVIPSQKHHRDDSGFGSPEIVFER